MKTRPEWSFTSIFLGVTHESLGFFGLSNEDVFFLQDHPTDRTIMYYQYVGDPMWLSDVSMSELLGGSSQLVSGL